jgi:hypothetical protein
LKNFADRFEEEYVASVVLRNEQIKGKGLDSEKIAARLFPSKKWKNWQKKLFVRTGF